MALNRLYFRPLTVKGLLYSMPIGHARNARNVENCKALSGI